MPTDSPTPETSSELLEEQTMATRAATTAAPAVDVERARELLARRKLILDGVDAVAWDDDVLAFLRRLAGECRPS